MKIAEILSRLRSSPPPSLSLSHDYVVRILAGRLSQFGPGRSSKLLFRNSESREKRSLLGVMPNDVGFVFHIIVVSKGGRCLFCVSGSMKLSGRGMYEG